MDIKRYSQIPTANKDMIETTNGEWVKYADMEVVFSILKERVIEMNIEINELKGQIPSANTKES